MMNLAILGLVTLSITITSSLVSLNLIDEWFFFKEKFNKTYTGNGEEEMRMQIFIENLLKINEHNLKYKQGLSTYKQNINKLTDLTFAEIASTRMSFVALENSIKKNYYFSNNKKDIPDTIDWRDVIGVVTEIKDQGSCGSGWAFSATGGIEGQWFLKKNISITLSEQNLIDCSYKNYGCGGGWMEFAYDYIVFNAGIDTEAGYPYKAKNEICQFDVNFCGANISSYKFIQANNELSLKDAVANIGPICIAFDANHESFFAYSDGIWDEPECQTDSFSHAALIVGYGNKNGIDYWLVKNSWGVDWGMQGYFMMRRNNYNQCGVAGHALYPII